MYNKAVYNMVEKDGVWELDTTLKTELFNGQEVNKIILNNGLYLLFMQDFFNISCRLSYDYGKTYKEAETWDKQGFNNYLSKLKAMTKEEVGRRQ